MPASPWVIRRPAQDPRRATPSLRIRIARPSLDTHLTSRSAGYILIGMDAGKLIRAARNAQGMTQVELAQAIGCSELSVINWERGGRPLRIYREKLEAVLGISLEEERHARQRPAPPGGGASF